ncbi:MULTISPECIES: diadenylate cyclase CdaA [unclassified Roseivirga]|uniref:diadenylate cyclase CdaA n=1 Tax=unclassified Roseivirga TaxID=2626142 RepID=UPI00257D02FF|nr:MULTISPECIES: diadenylate cyclase CdaA [unclassified Roseivirga]MEC7752610.1 diadenylate cyclase CdaA [Bacteroidota bacterium]
MIFAFKIGFLDIRWIDILDILLVSVLLYQVYKLLKGSVAVRVLIGFLVLYLAYLVVRAAEMELLAGILGQFMGVGVLAAIIIFSQEIRKFLIVLGKTTFRKDGLIQTVMIWKRKEAREPFNITPIIEAAKSLSSTNTGALMVFSRNSELKFYADSGDRLDAVLSKRLLISIFNKYSPLHDGAIIIYEGKILAARCILPVSERDLPANFGMRHRAALGMSEATDSLILAVSEETGQISIIRNGYIDSNLSIPEIRKRILAYLSDKENAKSKSKPEQEDNLEVAS